MSDSAPTPTVPLSLPVARDQPFLQADSDLERFSVALDDALTILALIQDDQIQYATRAARVLREILRRETGQLSVEGGVDEFCVRTVAPAATRELIRSLQAKFVALQAGTEFSSQDISDFSNMLRHFAEWYVARCRTLSYIKQVEQISFADQAPFCRLFNLRLHHDVRHAGVVGMMVSAGLVVVGYRGDTLWLRALLSDGRSYVCARPEWTSWTDNGTALQLVEHQQPRFALLQPVEPEQHHLLVDQLRMFVPYHALEIGERRRSYQLQLAVCDSSFRELEDLECETVLWRPVDEVHSIPSPHSLGVWASDPLTSDRVEVQDMRLSYGGNSQGAILVLMTDLQVSNHAAKTCSLQCRLLGRDGEALEFEYAGQAKTGLLNLHSFQPQTSIANYSAVRSELQLPLEQPDLLEQIYSCEVLLLGHDRRVICGTVVPCRFADLQDSAPVRPRTGNLDGQLQAGSLFVKSFGEFANQIKIILPLQAGSQETSYRFVSEVSSANDPSAISVSESVLVRSENLREARAVHSKLTFPANQITQLDKLQVRARVYNARDELLVSEQVDYQLESSQLNHESDSKKLSVVKLVDLGLRAQFGAEQFVLSLIFNLDCSAYRGQTLCLYSELYDREDNVIVSASAELEQRDALPGQYSELDLSELLAAENLKPDIYQTRLSCFYQVAESSLATMSNKSLQPQRAKLMFFSEDGNLLHVAEHAVELPEISSSQEASSSSDWSSRCKRFFSSLAGSSTSGS